MDEDLPLIGHLTVEPTPDVLVMRLPGGGWAVAPAVDPVPLDGTLSDDWIDIGFTDEGDI